MPCRSETTGTAGWWDCLSDLKDLTEAIKPIFDTFSNIMTFIEFNVVYFFFPLGFPLQLCNSSCVHHPLTESSFVFCSLSLLSWRLTSSKNKVSLPNKFSAKREWQSTVLFWFLLRESEMNALHICRGEDCTFVKTTTTTTTMLFNMFGWCVSWCFCRGSPELWKRL